MNNIITEQEFDILTNIVNDVFIIPSGKSIYLNTFTNRIDVWGWDAGSFGDLPEIHEFLDDHGIELLKIDDEEGSRGILYRMVVKKPFRKPMKSEEFDVDQYLEEHGYSPRKTDVKEELGKLIRENSVDYIFNEDHPENKKMIEIVISEGNRKKAALLEALNAAGVIDQLPEYLLKALKDAQKSKDS